MNATMKGAVSENYVSWQLARSGLNSFRLGGNAEIDIVTTSGLRIEVKSSAGTNPSISTGSMNYSFSFARKQVNGKVKSDFCICVGFDKEYQNPLFSLCIPSSEMKDFADGKSPSSVTLGVRYVNGIVESTKNKNLTQYLNNWGIVR